MDKKTLHKKWYFRLIQIIFLASFIFFIVLGTWALFYEDDIPLAGYFWALIVALVYWVVKKILER